LYHSQFLSLLLLLLFFQITDPSDKKFKYQKEEIEGKLVQSIQNDEELKKYMNERKIAIPTYLKEFYIDSIDYLAKNNNRINTDDNTKTTKKEILNHIAGLDPQFFINS